MLFPILTMKRLKIPLSNCSQLLLAAVLWGLLWPAAAPANTRPITENLLQEGYALEHATVEGLIRTIRSQNFEEIDKYDALRNLQTFFPHPDVKYDRPFRFSFENGKAVLNLIFHLSENDLMNDELDWLTGIFHRIQMAPADFLNLMMEVALALPDEDPKIQLLEELARFNSHSEQALSQLEKMLESMSPENRLQSRVAFIFLRLGVNTTLAESVISRALSTTEKTASSVFFKAHNSSDIEFSASLLEKMQGALAMFEGKERSLQTLKLNRVRARQGLEELPLPLSDSECLDLVLEEGGYQ